jgi:hypothetical protein
MSQLFFSRKNAENKFEKISNNLFNSSGAATVVTPGGGMHAIHTHMKHKNLYDISPYYA